MTAVIALSARELAALVRAREVSAVEVLDTYVERVESRNPRLNALVQLRVEAARREAVALDGRLRRGEDVGPLCGVPFSVKDVLSVSGMPTTAGSLLLQQNYVARDATVVARARKADAILLGKSNTSEFALWMHTRNRLYGATLSPFGASSPGGSSGGEAVAVASGMVPIGFGTDYGGSVRWPAHCTGVVGMRPTIGRVPFTGFVPGIIRRGHSMADPNGGLRRLSSIGILARALEDLEPVLEVVSGPDGWDAGCCPCELRMARMVRVETLDVSWNLGESVVPVETEIKEACWRVIQRVAGVARSVRTVRDEVLRRSSDVYVAMRAHDPLVEVRELSRGREGELSAEVHALVAKPALSDAEGRAEVWADREAIRAEILAEMGDAMLLPVAPVCALPIGTERAVVRGEELDEWRILSLLRPVSLTGLPCVVVPVGVSSSGLPIGIQVIAKPFREDVAIAVAKVAQEEEQGVDR